MSNKQRRGVKFNHKHGADARRLSLSEVSEEGSPTKSGRLLVVGDGAQDVRLLPCHEIECALLLTFLRIQAAPPTEAEKQAEYEKKKANFITRTFWTFVMIGGFFTALFLGHIYI